MLKNDSGQRELYERELSKRVKRVFMALKEGYEAPEELRLHAEGFMQAGVFLKIMDLKYQKELVKQIHMQIFGMTIEERFELGQKNISNPVNYSEYEIPTYIRRREDRT